MATSYFFFQNRTLEVNLHPDYNGLTGRNLRTLLVWCRLINGCSLRFNPNLPSSFKSHISKKYRIFFQVEKQSGYFSLIIKASRTKVSNLTILSVVHQTVGIMGLTYQHLNQSDTSLTFYHMFPEKHDNWANVTMTWKYHSFMHRAS